MSKTRKLTPMQREYANQRAHGVKRKDAALAAGYSTTSADQQAYALEQRDDIKREITSIKRALKKGGAKVEEESEDGLPKDHYDDAKELLIDLMNLKRLPHSLRGDYAKALLPYQHARIGETGKKETAKGAAQKIASGETGKPGQKPKFATKQPPQLRVVGGSGG